MPSGTGRRRARFRIRSPRGRHLLPRLVHQEEDRLGTRGALHQVDHPARRLAGVEGLLEAEGPEGAPGRGTPPGRWPGRRPASPRRWGGSWLRGAGRPGCPWRGSVHRGSPGTGAPGTPGRDPGQTRGKPAGRAQAPEARPPWLSSFSPALTREGPVPSRRAPTRGRRRRMSLGGGHPSPLLPARAGALCSKREVTGPAGVRVQRGALRGKRPSSRTRKEVAVGSSHPLRPPRARHYRGSDGGSGRRCPSATSAETMKWSEPMAEKGRRWTRAPVTRARRWWGTMM